MEIAVGRHGAPPILSRRAVLALAGGLLAAGALARVAEAGPAAAPGGPATETDRLLLVTNSAGRHVSVVDPASGVVERIEVGAAPWGIALAPDGRGYVSTAEGLAVLDLAGRRL